MADRARTKIITLYQTSSFERGYGQRDYSQSVNEASGGCGPEVDGTTGSTNHAKLEVGQVWQRDSVSLGVSLLFSYSFACYHFWRMLIFFCSKYFQELIKLLVFSNN